MDLEYLKELKIELEAIRSYSKENAGKFVSIYGQVCIIYEAYKEYGAPNALRIGYGLYDDIAKNMTSFKKRQHKSARSEYGFAHEHLLDIIDEMIKS